MDRIGIYKIENIENGKVYIGQSVTVSHRLHEHRRKLNNHTHGNSHLQSAWDKYGEDKFTFELIEECSKEQLTEREGYWLEYYGGHESRVTYNAKTAEEHPKYSKEVRERMSRTRKGTNKGKDNPMYGRGHTLESRKKISDKVNEWYKTHDAVFKGKHHTDESKRKLSDAHKGKKASQETKELLSKITKERWEKNKQDPEFMAWYSQRMKDTHSGKYTEEQKQEIYNTFKQLNSRKATSKALGIPLESCRLIINKMLQDEQDN